MNYNIKDLGYHELQILLNLIPTQVLSQPIAKDFKYFSKQIKGFNRPNKIPNNILYKFYYDEISQTDKLLLEKYVKEIIKTNFKDTKIENIVDIINQNGISEPQVLELEEEIINCKLKISPLLILKISGCEIPDNMKVFNDVHNYILKLKHIYNEEKKNEITSFCTEKDGIIYKLQDEIKLLTSEVKSEKLLVDKLTDKLEKYSESADEIIKLRNNEINKLIVYNQNLNVEITRLQKLENENKQLIQKLAKYESMIEEVNNEKEGLYVIIQELKSNNQSSKDILKELCEEAVADLKLSNAKDNEIAAEFDKFFNNDVDIIEAWKKLSTCEIDIINGIVAKMDGNEIKSDDIAFLDNVEMYVSMKYLIIKALKVLFFKYLEQRTHNNSINSNFAGE